MSSILYKFDLILMLFQVLVIQSLLKNNLKVMNLFFMSRPDYVLKDCSKILYVLRPEIS